MSFITASGDTIELWPHRPNGEVVERLEWKSDVLSTFDGGEQRIDLRAFPRRRFEFGSSMSNRARREAENLLYAWQGLKFGLPLWMDGEPLASNVAAASTVIPVTTDTRDYHVGGLVALIRDERTFEIAEIDSLAADSVTTVQARAQGFTAGLTSVTPVRVGQLPDDVTIARFTGGDGSLLLQWECVDDSAWPAAVESTYRSYPVLATKPNWTEDVQQKQVRKLGRIDPQVGKRVWDEESSGAIAVQTHRWLLDGRSEIGAFRSWLYARRGRVSAFWIPSFAQDFSVVATIGPAATTIDVEHSNYSARVGQGINRRDIRIELLNGTVYHRRITGSAELGADTERLVIDSALGATVNPADVGVVCFMQLSRLESDAVELAWWKHDVVECALSVRSFRNDL